MHVDSAGSEVEELKPPVKTSECPPLGQISEKGASSSSSVDRMVTKGCMPLDILYDHTDKNTCHL